ncbi:unnamed protein product [Peniophora sp. CBMAI 1063]|nr:unnamed protein product [Peniophora sp. CBMAI 1063]
MSKLATRLLASVTFGILLCANQPVFAQSILNHTQLPSSTTESTITASSSFTSQHTATAVAAAGEQSTLDRPRIIIAIAITLASVATERQRLRLSRLLLYRRVCWPDYNTTSVHSIVMSQPPNVVETLVVPAILTW